MNILLVDDQALMEEMLADDLRAEGHVLKRIGESDLVMDLVVEDTPDVVLLDLYLNGFEGWHLLGEIKHFSQDLPVFILSAYDGFRDDSRLAAADGYVVKGIDMGEKVKDLLKNIAGTEQGKGRAR